MVHVCVRMFLFFLSSFFIATHAHTHTYKCLQHIYTLIIRKTMTFTIFARRYSARHQITKQHEIHLTNVFILMCLCQSSVLSQLFFLSYFFLLHLSLPIACVYLCCDAQGKFLQDERLPNTRYFHVAFSHFKKFQHHRDLFSFEYTAKCMYCCTIK